MTRAGCWTVCVGLLVGLALGCNERTTEQPEPFDIEWVGCIRETEPWKTCAEFCEWDGAVCAPSGCDGQTVRGFSSVGFCSEDESPQPLELGCEDEFVFSGEFNAPASVSAIDCCCDYR